jgi:hypothetical protein
VLKWRDENREGGVREASLVFVEPTRYERKHMLQLTYTYIYVRGGAAIPCSHLYMDDWDICVYRSRRHLPCRFWRVAVNDMHTAIPGVAGLHSAIIHSS